MLEDVGDQMEQDLSPHTSNNAYLPSVDAIMNDERTRTI